GEVRVQIESADYGVYLDRTFLPGETREVRVYLHGDSDVATVDGDGPGTIRLRIIGGGGDDRLEDTSAAGAIFYDDDGDNEILAGPETLFDGRSFVVPEADTLIQNNRPPLRDWGAERSFLSPSVGWRSEIGPVIGLGPVW